MQRQYYSWNQLFKNIALLTVSLLVAAIVFLPNTNTTDDFSLDYLSDIREAQNSFSTRQQVADAVETKNPPATNREPEQTTVAKSSPALPQIAEPAPSEVLDDSNLKSAIELIDAGRIEDAVSTLEEILKQDPKNEQALVELAMINLLDLKQSAAAIDYLERAIEVNPENRIVVSELVGLYEEENRIDDGINYLQQLMEANPNSPGVAHGLGQIYVSQGRDSDAIPYLEKAAAQIESPVRAQRDLAEAYSRTGKKEKAIESYKKAIAAGEVEISGRGDDQNSSFERERINYIKMDLARELMSDNKWEEAESTLKELESAMPGDEQVANLLDILSKRRRAG